MTIKAKICGLTSRAAVEACVEGAAAAVGFNFYAPSPRFLTPQDASALKPLLPDHVLTVALVVDAGDTQIAEINDRLDPQIFQLHGAETPDRVRQIAAMTGKKVMKSIAVSDAGDLQRAKDYETAADLLLFDAKPPKSLPDALPGGNALTFDWSILSGRSWKLPWLLAGGISAGNVAEAVRISGADFVDVSSGVERERGRKDPELITEFLNIVRSL